MEMKLHKLKVYKEGDDYDGNGIISIIVSCAHMYGIKICIDT